VLDTVPIASANYGVVATKYNALGPLLPFGSKADAPASAIIPMVKAALQADLGGNGQKVVLFVTDGDTDFCDDGNTLCPLDAVTYRLQDLYAAGITTLVMGLPSNLTSSRPGTLQALANAGAGLPVALPMQGTTALTPADIYGQCIGSAEWATLRTAAGRTGTTATATYQPAGGNATVYMPNATDQTAASGVVAALRSCAFDLVGNFSIDGAHLGGAHVLIGGTQIPHDDANGWRLTSPTRVELVGAACATLRTPGSGQIAFQFPCESIVL
jgi:hypothetical protein